MLKSFGDLEFVSCQNDGEPDSIDILIGLDNYWRFIKPSIVPGRDGLVAQDSVFGWIISGSCSGARDSSGVNFVAENCAVGQSPSGGRFQSVDNDNHSIVSHQLLCLNDISEERLRNFWTWRLLAYQITIAIHQIQC